MNNVSEISLKYIVELFKKNFIFVLLSFVLGVTAAFSYTAFYAERKYESAIKMFVYVAGDNLTPEQEHNNYIFSRNAIDSYIEMLNSRSFFQRVSESSHINYSAGQLMRMVRYSPVRNTEIFSATVIANNPEDAKAIADEICRFAPIRLTEIRDNASLRIVDHPILNNTPISPNKAMNLSIGGVIGIATAFLLVFLRDMLDSKIRSSSEIYERYGLSIIAEVSDINKKDRKAAKKIMKLKKGSA